jgi:hypothetical protein
MASLLVRLGHYIQTKRNFIRVSIAGIGVPFGIAGAFLVEPYGPPAVVIILFLAPLAGWMWGTAMWHLWYKPLQEGFARRRRGEAHREGGDAR